MRKPKRLYEPLFKATYFLCYGWTVKDFDALLRKEAKGCEKLGPKKDEEGSTIRDDRGVLFVWSIRRDPAVFAHECLHAATFALTDRGIRFSRESDEVFVYTVELLMREGTKK